MENASTDSMHIPKWIMTDDELCSLFTGRSSEGPMRWGQRSLTPLQSVSHSLDVGIPSPRREGVEEGVMGGFLFRLTDRPVCRAVLLTSVVTMMMLLTGIVIFLLTYNGN